MDQNNSHYIQQQKQQHQQNHQLYYQQWMQNPNPSLSYQQYETTISEYRMPNSEMSNLQTSLNQPNLMQHSAMPSATISSSTIQSHMTSPMQKQNNFSHSYTHSLYSQMPTLNNSMKVNINNQIHSPSQQLMSNQNQLNVPALSPSSIQISERHISFACNTAQSNHHQTYEDFSNASSLQKSLFNEYQSGTNNYNHEYDQSCLNQSSSRLQSSLIHASNYFESSTPSIYLQESNKFYTKNNILNTETHENKNFCAVNEDLPENYSDWHSPNKAKEKHIHVEKMETKKLATPESPFEIPFSQINSANKEKNLNDSQKEKDFLECGLHTASSVMNTIKRSLNEAIAVEGKKQRKNSIYDESSAGAIPMTKPSNLIHVTEKSNDYKLKDKNNCSLRKNNISVPIDKRLDLSSTVSLSESKWFPLLNEAQQNSLKELQTQQESFKEIFENWQKDFDHWRYSNHDNMSKEKFQQELNMWKEWKEQMSERRTRFELMYKEKIRELRDQVLVRNPHLLAENKKSNFSCVESSNLTTIVDPFENVKSINKQALQISKNTISNTTPVKESLNESQLNQTKQSIQHSSEQSLNNKNQQLEPAQQKQVKQPIKTTSIDVVKQNVIEKNDQSITQKIDTQEQIKKPQNSKQPQNDKDSKDPNLDKPSDRTKEKELLKNMPSLSKEHKDNLPKEDNHISKSLAPKIPSSTELLNKQPTKSALKKNSLSCDLIGNKEIRVHVLENAIAMLSAINKTRRILRTIEQMDQEQKRINEQKNSKNKAQDLEKQNISTNLNEDSSKHIKSDKLTYSNNFISLQKKYIKSTKSSIWNNFDKKYICLESILNEPERNSRPERLVIILRGLPGSGKSYLADIIKRKEERHKVPVHLLRFEDYFMVKRSHKIFDETGTMKIVENDVYEYDETQEKDKRLQMFQDFQKLLIKTGPRMIIVDAINHRINHFSNFYARAVEAGWISFVGDMEFTDVAECHRLNIHQWTMNEMRSLETNWQRTPRIFIVLRTRRYFLDHAEFIDRKVLESSKNGNIRFLCFNNKNPKFPGNHRITKFECLELATQKIQNLTDGFLMRKREESYKAWKTVDDYDLRRTSTIKRVTWEDLEKKFLSSS